ncbi:MAG: glycoside hydrolase family 38 C-terminal domain-containing protein [Hydrogeniiclostridium mannosilyticum]
MCSEMMTRFQKSRNISDTYARVALEALAAQTDTRFAAAENDYGTLVVFNPQPFAADEPVCVEFVYPSSEAPEAFRVTDSDGHACPCQITAARDREFIRSDFKSVQHFAKDRVFQAVLQAGPLPAFGIKAFRLEKAAANENAPEDALLVSKESRTVENAYITLSVADNGTLTLTDKATGYVYRDLNYFIEEGDGGDAYIFNQIPGGSVHDSRSLRWDIEFLQDGPLQAACRLKAEWELPFEMTGHAAGRSAQVVKNSLEYLVHVYAGSPVVRIQLHVDNRSKDHRIRAYFPTSIQSDHVWADGQFSLEKRTGSRLHGTMPQQTFCAVSGEQRGLAILEKGLHQYDYLDDGNGTLALSIIRGQGALYRGFFERYNDEYSRLNARRLRHGVCYLSLCHPGRALPDIVLQKAAQFNTGLRSTQTGSHEGRIPPARASWRWKRAACSLSFSFQRTAAVLGLFLQPRAISVQARMALALPVDSAVRMNMHEDVLQPCPLQTAGSRSRPVPRNCYPWL